MQTTIETFLERAEEIIAISRCFEKYNIVCITGEMGIGKTFLATQFARSLELTESASMYKKRVFLTPNFSDSWENVITRLARDLLDEFPKKFNSKELEFNIINYISEHKIWLLLNDFNNDRLINDIIGFIRTWAEKVHNGSKLLITLREFPFGDKKSIPGECFEYPLKGISEDKFIRRILGENLFRFIVDNGMKDELKQLGGNPMKLRHLRMGMPKDPKSEDKEKLQRYIREILVLREEDNAKKDVLETILKFIKSDNKNFPLDHFLVLGRVRALEFDEALIDFLWDSLGCGNTQSYVQSLESLIRDGLLELVPGIKRRIRLDAFSHMMLEKYCIEYFGEKRIPLIDYFISEYYRNYFSESRKESFNLEILNHYVYHALRSGNYDSAYSYIFEGDILNTAHNSGLAVELKPILSYFYNYWYNNFIRDNDLNNERNSRLAEQWVMIQMELSRIYKDLSEHEESLRYLSEVNETLRKKMVLGIDESIRHEIQRKIWHFSGVEFSQIGETKECLNAYISAVKYASEHNSFTTLDALSLGYLSYELKFHDIELSEKVGMAALELCDKIEDPDIRSVKIKNLCSLAQIRAFMRKKIESKQNFVEAYELCEKPPKDNPKEITRDSRELGRILINSAVIYIYSKEWEEVENRLKYAFGVYEESGDKRRKAMGIAYKGIMLYRREKLEEGKKKVLEAFEVHKTIKAQREMIYEALTYMWMVDPGLTDKLVEIVVSQKDTIALNEYWKMKKRDDIPIKMYDCIREVMDTESTIFVDFWVDYYKPTLLLEKAEQKNKSPRTRG